MNKEPNVYLFNDECYVYLAEYKKLQQELTDYKERNENAIEYVKEHIMVISDAIPLKDTIAGKDLLEILDKKDKE